MDQSRHSVREQLVSVQSEQLLLARGEEDRLPATLPCDYNLVLLVLPLRVHSQPQDALKCYLNAARVRGSLSSSLSDRIKFLQNQLEKAPPTTQT